jgi:hypothetical protein
MSILDENPYDLPLDEPEVIDALQPELPDVVVHWLIARRQAEVQELAGELQRRHGGDTSA